MKRHLMALTGACAALLGAGPAVAGAQAVQGAEQYAGTGQSASSNASSTQTSPSNENISVRIFSPGDAGSVAQENTSAAGAAAGNEAATVQNAAQSQSGGGGGEQAAGQVAETGQEAAAEAVSEQVKPSNSNISVRIHSPGDDGDVSQSNRSAAGAAAGNEAATQQTARQDQGGGGSMGGGDKGGGDKGGGHKGGGGDCCQGSGVQAVGQKAETWQEADADATSKQYAPRNSNISVRIGSPGDGGSVSQSNSSAAIGKAGNEADTEQGVRQSQRGRCGCAADLVQAVGQKALTGQKADADATSIQKGAHNKNAPVRIHSYGDDGDVHQSNASLAFAGAFNDAATKQLAGQKQTGGRCGCPKDHGKYYGKGHGGAKGAGVQAAGQWAETWQDADADATSAQYGAKNVNAPLRIKSRGDGGDFQQANTSRAAALAMNRAFTFQGVFQEQ